MQSDPVNPNFCSQTIFYTNDLQFFGFYFSTTKHVWWELKFDLCRSLQIFTSWIWTGKTPSDNPGFQTPIHMPRNFWKTSILKLRFRFHNLRKKNGAKKNWLIQSTSQLTHSCLYGYPDSRENHWFDSMNPYSKRKKKTIRSLMSSHFFFFSSKFV